MQPSKAETSSPAPRPAFSGVAEKCAVCRDFRLSQFPCGLATVTSASRMIFAFARDYGLVGSSFLKKSEPCPPHPQCRDLDIRDSRPFCFVWGASLVTIAGGFVLIRSSSRARSSSCSSRSAIPIALGLIAYGRTWTRMGPWDLGGPLFRLFVAILSILSALLIFFIGIQPPNDWALWHHCRLPHPHRNHLGCSTNGVVSRARRSAR